MAKATQTKPGWQTTEFWLTLAAELLGLLLLSGVLNPLPEDHWVRVVVGGALTVLAALGYQASRTKVKAADALTKGS